MTDDQFFGVIIIFIVLCVTAYKMHENTLENRKTKKIKEHRKKWDWIWKEHERQMFETGRLQEKPSEAPIPPTKMYTKTEVSNLINKWSEDNMETYYVVARNNRYVDGVHTTYGDSTVYEVSVTTTKSLLDCNRYETYEEAKEFADKYNCTVRKVIVKVE